MSNTTTEKKCKKCEKVKPVSDFNKMKAAADGLTFECKACKSKYDRERLQAKKENFFL